MFSSAQARLCLPAVVCLGLPHAHVHDLFDLKGESITKHNNARELRSSLQIDLGAAPVQGDKNHKEESASHPTSPFVFGKGSATSDKLNLNLEFD